MATPRTTWSRKFCMSASNTLLYRCIVSSVSVTTFFPSLLQKKILLRIISDEMGTFKGLLRDLPQDSAHRRNLMKCVVLHHEAVHLIHLLEKVVHRFVAIHLTRIILDAQDSTLNAIFAYGCTSGTFPITVSNILITIWNRWAFLTDVRENRIAAA